MYVFASEDIVRRRIKERAKLTGRDVPEFVIQKTLKSPEKSISLLARQTDLIIRINNNISPKLDVVEDHTGNWYRSLGKIFQTFTTAQTEFPESIDNFYLKCTSFIDTKDGNYFVRKNNEIFFSQYALKNNLILSHLTLTEQTQNIVLSHRSDLTFEYEQDYNLGNESAVK